MSNNIPFIHNYCDRWCERCCFTGRCAVYEETKDYTEDEMDPNNKAFWDKISNNFKKTIEMLHQGAKEHGIDLNSINREDVEATERQQKKIDRLVKDHLLTKLCKQYSGAAHKISSDEAFWKVKADEMIGRVTLGIVNEDQIREEIYHVKDCKEVISWYSDFIWVKFNRALSGKMDGYEDEEEIQADSNGSAKIALVAVDRSLQAWRQLLDLIPDEDRIIPLLSILSKIDKLARQEFPKAFEFVRPGFDEA